MRRRLRWWRVRATPLFLAVLVPTLACAGGGRSGKGRHDDGSVNGRIAGQVVLEGEIPRSWRAEGESWAGTLTHPPQAWDGTPPREIEADASGGVRGVAVWLEPVEEDTPSSVEPSEDRFRVSVVDGEAWVGVRFPPPFEGRPATPPEEVRGPSREPVIVRLEGSCFWPMTIVVERGGSVRLVNADARLHHVQFLSAHAPRSMMIGPGESAEIVLADADLIRLTCNDHAFMRADLIVTPGPWAAVTDAEGRFEIGGLPGGKYRVRFAHHRLSEAADAPIIAVGGEASAPTDLLAGRGHWGY